MKAGWFPESIKYSIAAKTAKKITRTLMYDGINFFIIFNILKIILLDFHSMEFDSFHQSFLFYMK